MKISVLGNIIDTENIYQITPIYQKQNDHFSFTFSILFFNDKEFKVFKNAGVYFDGSTYLNIPEENIKDYKEGTQERAINSITYKKNLKEIETLRDVVISYWSNNQSNIPKIEFI